MATYLRYRLPPTQAAASAVPELVEAGVVDAEVVGDLVGDRDLDLLDHVLLRIADPQRRIAIDEDPVRKGAAIAPAALGLRDAAVEAEDVRLVRRRIVLDEQHDVVEQPDQLVGDPGERGLDELLEPLPGHRDHRAIVTHLASRTTGLVRTIATLYPGSVPDGIASPATLALIV